MVIDSAPEYGGAEGLALASGRNKVLTSFGICKYSLWKKDQHLKILNLHDI